MVSGHQHVLGCDWAGGLPVLPSATRKWASPPKPQSSGQCQESTEKKDKKRETNKDIFINSPIK